MNKKISKWTLSTVRPIRSTEVIQLISLGKGKSISEAVAKEKKSVDISGQSEDGQVTVKRVGAYGATLTP